MNAKSQRSLTERASNIITHDKTGADMKTGICYFYTDQIKSTRNEKTGLLNKHYTVLLVNVYNNNLDNANRKARTINDKLGFGKMPGGWTCCPGDYTLSMFDVISVPDITKIQPLISHDHFIIDLIERESNMEYIIL